MKKKIFFYIAPSVIILASLASNSVLAEMDNVNKNISKLIIPSNINNTPTLSMAEMLLNEGKYQEAIDVYFKLANAGDISAQEKLGEIYENGNIVKKDLQKALYWYEKSANAGNSKAQMALANWYYTGTEVKPDLAKALEVWNNLAAKNNDVAQYMLGQFYFNDNKNQNYEKAFTWYEKSANLGNALAALKVADMYQSGTGVTKSYILAKHWYEVAASKNNAQAQENLGAYYNNEKNYKEAFKWYNEAYKNGNNVAAYGLAHLYLSGNVTGAPEFIQSSSILRQAILQENKNNQPNPNYLALMYFDLAQADNNTSNPFKNPIEAVKMYTQACALSQNKAKVSDSIAKPILSEAGLALGEAYQNGVGISASLFNAFYWYQVSANVGNAEAQRLTGLLYMQGTGIPRDTKKGIYFIAKSANQNNAQAQLWMGLAYAPGGIIKTDVSEADKWLSLAAQNNLKEALNAKLLLEKNMTNAQLMDTQEKINDWKAISE